MSVYTDFPFPANSVLSIDSRSKFEFSENRMIYRAINSSQKKGYRLQIDGKLYSDETKKCDYGLLLEDGRFFLIELKGVDVSDACKQLITTLVLIKNDYSKYDFDFFCRIVARQGLPKTNTNRQRLIKELGKMCKYSNDKFKSRVNFLEEKI